MVRVVGRSRQLSDLLLRGESCWSFPGKRFKSMKMAKAARQSNPSLTFLKGLTDHICAGIRFPGGKPASTIWSPSWNLKLIKEGSHYLTITIWDTSRQKKVSWRELSRFTATQKKTAAGFSSKGQRRLGRQTAAASSPREWKSITKSCPSIRARITQFASVIFRKGNH